MEKSKSINQVNFYKILSNNIYVKVKSKMSTLTLNTSFILDEQIKFLVFEQMTTLQEALDKCF